MAALSTMMVVGVAVQLLSPQAEAFVKGPRPGGWAETLSWKPRAYVYHGFLSDDECKHLKTKAAPRLARSSVINADGTTTPEDKIRTSAGMFFKPGEDEHIRDIDERVALWTHLPVSHGESMQVLRYENNQHYGGHWDEADPEVETRTVGGESPRVATLIIYLEDVEEGGETAFPKGEWIDEKIQTQGLTFSECTGGGVAVKPRRGDALLFFGLKNDVSRFEPYSFHTGCPVLKGTKWTAVYWLHTRPFSPTVQRYGTA